MFTTLFLVKYLFRVMHIGSLVLICHAVITAKMTGQIVKDHHALYMAAGILVIVSGTHCSTQAWSTPSSSSPRKWARRGNYGWPIITPRPLVPL